MIKDKAGFAWPVANGRYLARLVVIGGSVFVGLLLALVTNWVYGRSTGE